MMDARAAVKRYNRVVYDDPGTIDANAVAIF
jgi:hypothetical protein